jgi:hypothetical protein
MHSNAFVALVLLVVAITASATYGDVVTVEPTEPRWGQTITVTYDTRADGAIFLPTDDVRLVAFSYQREMARQIPCPVTRDGDRLVARLPIESGMSAMTLYFVSRHKYDQTNATSIMVNDADGTPAPGAHLQQMFNAGDDWEANFDREMTLHPDSLYAYRQKWFIAGAFAPDRLKPMVETDLAALEMLTGKDPIEWLYVQVFGRMALGDEPAGRAALLELFEQHSEAFLADVANRDYRYACYGQSITGEGPDAVTAAMFEAMKRLPTSPLARENALTPVHHSLIH